MMIRTDLYRDLVAGKRHDNSVARIIRAVATLIIGTTASIGILAYQDATSLRSKLAAAKASEEDLATRLDVARQQDKELDIRVRERDAVLNYARNRVNWAPLLEGIFASVAENIELSSLRANCVGQEDCEVVITGRTAAEGPRLECDKFRLLLLDLFKNNGITASADFDRLEDSTSKIQIGDTTYPSADFTVAIRWKNPPQNSPQIPPQNHGK